jgi:hypothetical protein
MKGYGVISLGLLADKMCVNLKINLRTKRIEVFDLQSCSEISFSERNCIEIWVKFFTKLSLASLGRFTLILDELRYITGNSH